MRMVLKSSRLFRSSSGKGFIFLQETANSFAASLFSASTYAGISPINMTSPPDFLKFFSASSVVFRIVVRLGTTTASYFISPMAKPLSVFLYCDGSSDSQMKSKSMPPQMSVLAVSQKRLSFSRRVIDERSFGP